MVEIRSFINSKQYKTVDVVCEARRKLIINMKATHKRSCIIQSGARFKFSLVFFFDVDNSGLFLGMSDTTI